MLVPLGWVGDTPPATCLQDDQAVGLLRRSCLKTTWPFCPGCARHHTTSPARGPRPGVEHCCWVGGLGAHWLHLQAAKTQALGLRINVVILATIKQPFFRSADLPQLSIASIYLFIYVSAVKIRALSFHCPNRVVCRAAFSITLCFRNDSHVLLKQEA